MNEKALVEALIFASKGITLKKLSRITGIEEKRLEEIISSIKTFYESEDRGVELREVDGEYGFYTKRDYGDYVEKLLGKRFTKLTPQQLEVVVIIAMKGPLTKSEIDSSRGKDSSNIIRTLHRMGVLRRRRKGKRILYDLSKPFKESALYEEIMERLRGEEHG